MQEGQRYAQVHLLRLCNYSDAKIERYKHQSTHQYLNHSVEFCKGQLINQRQSHSCVLKHVFKVKKLHFVLGRMYLIVTVFEVRFDDESRWVACLRG